LGPGGSGLATLVRAGLPAHGRRRALRARPPARRHRGRLPHRRARAVDGDRRWAGQRPCARTPRAARRRAAGRPRWDHRPLQATARRVGNARLPRADVLLPHGDARARHQPRVVGAPAAPISRGARRPRGAHHRGRVRPGRARRARAPHARRPRHPGLSAGLRPARSPAGDALHRRPLRASGRCARGSSGGRLDGRARAPPYRRSLGPAARAARCRPRHPPGDPRRAHDLVPTRRPSHHGAPGGRRRHPRHLPRPHAAGNARDAGPCADRRAGRRAPRGTRMTPVVAVEPLAAVVTAAIAIIYLLFYTPLKRVSSLCSLVGAIPGALPPVAGWAAARGTLGPEPWILFAIMFLWQIPHTLAIGRMYRDDYARAGIRVLPVVDRDGRTTGLQAVCNCLALVPVALLPTVVGLAGAAYFLVALVL